MTVLTINAAATFLGVITGVSAYNLKNRRDQMKKENSIVIEPFNGSFLFASKWICLYDQQ